MARRAPSPEAPELSSRDREILKDTIRAFIVNGEPVSSRWVARAGRNQLSSATVRNVMADLEDWGYLAQPHTSAGRVPTRAGYHLYIDSLMSSRRVSRRERLQIDETVMTEAGGFDHLLASTSQLLSDMTHQIGIVVTPNLGETTLRSITFVNLTGCKVLCILVSTGGFSENKVIETSGALDREELIRISNYLTDNYSGLTLRQVRNRLIEAMSEERAKVDRLLGDAIQMAQEVLRDGEGPGVFVEGTTAVLSQPELADLERVRLMLGAFSDHASLVQMLNHVIDGAGVRVLIGKECDLTSDLDFSMVATTYGEEGTGGSLAIVGPSRMEYQKVIPLVDYFGEKLSQALERAFAGGTDV
ncbi:MAG: heat-inducible transcriptional repressor HrcA [Acidobacteriota bacterium]|nr:heat-inducible transcriptional repressor HrcA [Acidobacteriota bacterium]